MSDEYCPTSRNGARELGLRYYFPHKPCRRGHQGQRYTSHGNCVSCTKITSKLVDKDKKRIKNKEWCQANHNRVRELGRLSSIRWRKNHQERAAEVRRNSQEKNRESLNASGRAKYAENKVARIAKSRAWNIANADKVAAREAARRAAKGRATPSWADRTAMLAVYTECARISRETGIKYHVDHIVPLQGKNVCGLHVPWNLRVIPAVENISKGNRMLKAA